MDARKIKAKWLKDHRPEMISMFGVEYRFKKAESMDGLTYITVQGYKSEITIVTHVDEIVRALYNRYKVPSVIHGKPTIDKKRYGQRK